EITLRGAVLPVGGIKEKVLAAHRAGVKRVVLPERNQKDLVDIPEEVRKSMEVVLVKRVDEVLLAALEPAPRPEVELPIHGGHARLLYRRAAGAGGRPGFALRARPRATSAGEPLRATRPQALRRPRGVPPPDRREVPRALPASRAARLRSDRLAGDAPLDPR